MRVAQNPTVEAERALIVAACTWPERIDEVELDAGAFSVPKYSEAWRVIRSLRDRGEAVDGIIVAAELSASGAKFRLSELSEGIDQVSPMSVSRYAEIVRLSHVARRTVFACSKAVTAFKDGRAGDELLSDALEELSRIDVEQPDDALTIGELLRERFQELIAISDAKQRGELAATGIPTGIAEVDSILGGIQRGIATVIAGRPGMGKSALAMSLTDGASELGCGTHVFSMEDTRAAYTDRAMSRKSGVSAERIRSMSLNRGELDSIDRMSRELRKRGGWLVDDRSGLTAEEVVRSVRRNRKRNQTQLVVVDYLQLLRMPPFAKRHEALTDAMQTFANAAKQDRIAYVILSQLNRQCESRDDKRPLLSDLKDSGGIEERSKCILFVYRPSVYRERYPKKEWEKEGELIPESVMEIIIRKNNQGATGKVVVSFDPETIRIY